MWCFALLSRENSADCKKVTSDLGLGESARKGSVFLVVLCQECHDNNNLFFTLFSSCVSYKLSILPRLALTILSLIKEWEKSSSFFVESRIPSI